MRLRSTLNGLEPRTAREASQDPYDWFEAPDRAPPPLYAKRILAMFVAALVLMWFGVI